MNVLAVQLGLRASSQERADRGGGRSYTPRKACSQASTEPDHGLVSMKSRCSDNIELYQLVVNFKTNKSGPDQP